MLGKIQFRGVCLRWFNHHWVSKTEPPPVVSYTWVVSMCMHKCIGRSGYYVIVVYMWVWYEKYLTSSWYPNINATGCKDTHIYIFLYHKEVIKLLLPYERYGFGTASNLESIAQGPQVWLFFHVFQQPTATECQSCQCHWDHYVSIIIFIYLNIHYILYIYTAPVRQTVYLKSSCDLVFQHVKSCKDTALGPSNWFWRPCQHPLPRATPFLRVVDSWNTMAGEAAKGHRVWGKNKKQKRKDSGYSCLAGPFYERHVSS